ncbi:MAG: class I SAM-dependent methyltransferase, partial [Candidatus Marinimicrobia bacterium]|nr:class I SAM-dependent methyltransferase [Candidatus Neomarinimicrobiota bacterium]
MSLIKQLFQSGETKAHQKLMAWIFSHIDIGPEDQVLEVGFGLGELLQMAAKNVTKGKVVGVEILPAMVKRASDLNAKAISAGRMEIINGDANNLPYENNHFDKVFALNVVYFWTDLSKTINELCRVIKPGGIIALYLAPRILIEEMKKQAERFGAHYLRG